MDTTSSSPVRTAFFIGRPGCGKGTQTRLLAERTDWETFSTGERFKDLRSEAGPLGERVRAVFDTGALLPDWFAEHLFAESMLRLASAKGVICEGFPRSAAQAEYAERVLSWLGREYRVIHILVTDEEAVRRQLARAKNEHRPDSDDEAKVRARLVTYHTHTAPVIDSFRKAGRLIEVDGMQTPEKIAEDVRTALGIA